MFEWGEDKTIRVKPPSKPKKLTGTRFAAIFNANEWSTPFSIWCEVTKTYEEPFVDTIYTKAGKAIEPKQIDYCKKVYFMNVRTPTDEYGANYFSKTHGDFFPDVPIVGGMWDALSCDSKNQPTTVIECKTTKRAEDWANGQIPEYYALQAALYAYLKGIDNVVMVASFLQETDYEHPEKFVPSVDNTILRSFKVSERYPNFSELMEYAKKWWDTYVISGISPKYDEKKDEKILKALRTKVIDTSITGIDEITAEIERLQEEITEHEKSVEDKTERLKTLKATLSAEMKKRFSQGDTTIEIVGKNYTFRCNKSMTKGIDQDAMAADGILKRYQTFTPKYTLTLIKKSEDK